jgi:L-ornithine Nalpha-acyltransferase
MRLKGREQAMDKDLRSDINRLAMMTNLRKILTKMRPIKNPDSLIKPQKTKASRDIVRDTMGLPLTLGRLGALEVRLAITRKDIRRAQKLRYTVFFEEMSAIAPTHMRLLKRDKDPFDRVCDHLLVIDHDHFSGPLKRKKPKVVGTYRLLRQDVADRNFGFYSASEFNITELCRKHPTQRFLELGRSCVLAPYRTKKTVELLWQGIWTYVRHHKLDVMIGCASLAGTNPIHHAEELSFMHHFCKAEEPWATSALPSRHVKMDMIEKDALDPKRALIGLPPLIKAYLRLGAKIGEGAVVDHQFGTTDVLIVMPVCNIDPKYIDYYRPDRFGPNQAS